LADSKLGIVKKAGGKVPVNIFFDSNLSDDAPHGPLSRVNFRHSPLPKRAFKTLRIGAKMIEDVSPSNLEKSHTLYLAERRRKFLSVMKPKSSPPPDARCIYKEILSGGLRFSLRSYCDVSTYSYALAEGTILSPGSGLCLPSAWDSVLSALLTDNWWFRSMT